MKIIATINPTSLTDNLVDIFKKYSVDIIRLNGAHIDVTFIDDTLNEIRDKFGDAPKIMIDLPGNKIRTANITEPISLKENANFYLYKDQFNFSDFINYLISGDTIIANDGLFTFTVTEIFSNKIVLKSYSDGKLFSGKGMHLTRKNALTELPLFFDKDILLIEAAVKNKIDCVGVSFVRKKEDIIKINSILKNTEVQPFFKIETAEAYENLNEILNAGEIFNIDRGDLSSAIGMENIPLAQRKIISEVKQHSKKIFLATQFFHYMVEHPIPLIAEIDGFYNALELGVDGIQLSEETAVGKYPEEILRLIRRMEKNFEK